MKKSSLSIIIPIAVCLLLCGCTGQTAAPPAQQPAPASSPATAQATTAATGAFTLRVDAVAPGSALPSVYTCTGGGESPEISWANIPQGTQTLVLVLDDPDAPKGTFTHWIVFNIPRGASGIPRAQTAVKEIATGGQQGTNSAGDRLYFPPCPPPGPQHRYIFRLYALDYTPGLPTADREGIETAMSGHVIGQTQVQTTFGRG